jgi:prephenate dehydratase
MITLESAGGNEAQLKQALHEVQDLTPWSRYLGTYPVLIDTP